MNEIDPWGLADNPRTVLHWYDFLCPFCYVGQQRNAILIRHGLQVDELAFQAHPEIPLGGTPAGPRNGPMYAALEREAREAGLRLQWPSTPSEYTAGTSCCRVGSAKSAKRFLPVAQRAVRSALRSR